MIEKEIRFSKIETINLYRFIHAILISFLLAILLNSLLPLAYAAASETGNPIRMVPLAAGDEHSLALKNDGTVWAWGLNSFGQLGDGSTTDHNTPVRVEGLSGITAVAAGYRHSLALKNDGSVWAWGLNNLGQLGDGTTIDRSTPIQVPGLANITVIVSGYYHNLALTSDGQVWAWGDNACGQLGDSSTTQRNNPVQVEGLSKITAIAAGYAHSLALKNDGTVWAWGDNGRGQLGDGSITRRNTPVQVEGLSGIISIAAGFAHSLTLKNDGSVWAWGWNTDGQLGDGTTTDHKTPVQATTPSGITAIAAGGRHSMAMQNGGGVWAWGQNYLGQLGNGVFIDSSNPVQVPGLWGAASITASYAHNIMVKNDGSVRAWGRNFSGQLGDGSNADRSTPVQVAGPDGEGCLGDVMYPASPSRDLVVTGIEALETQYLVKGTPLPEAGLPPTVTIDLIDASSPTVEVIWDEGTPAYDGNNTGTYAFAGTLVLPTGVSNPDNIKATLTVEVIEANRMNMVPIAVGGFHSLTLKEDGSLWAWGDNYYGQLGDGTNTDHQTPVQTTGIAGIKSVAAGSSHSLALKEDGTVWAWGHNNCGQLGDGTTTDQQTPMQVPGLEGITAIAARDWYSLALKCDGTLWAWGYNYYGQLGDGTKVDRSTPVRILSGVRAIACGDYYCLALRSDGSVWAWGSNYKGQLGDGTNTDRSKPVQVSGLSGIVSIAAGGDFSTAHSLALKSDGSLWAWGSNAYCQLGDGTTNNHNIPVQVPGLSGITALAAAGSYENAHSLALKNDGSVWAWGSNSYGQLGSDSADWQYTPVQIAGLPGIRAIAAVDDRSMALKSDGSLWVWGNNKYGQLGDGTTTSRSTPVQILDGVMQPGESGDNNDTRWQDYPENKNTSEIDKAWTVCFSKRLNGLTVNTDNVFAATDESGNNRVSDLAVQVDTGGQAIVVNYDHKALWQRGGIYYIFISDDVLSENGVRLKNPLRVKFTVAGEPF